MGEGTKTIAKAIACHVVEGSKISHDLLKCTNNTAEYINNEVPKLLDSYTCTTQVVRGPEHGWSNRTLTVHSILILCSGTPKPVEKPKAEKAEKLENGYAGNVSGTTQE